MLTERRLRQSHADKSATRERRLAELAGEQWGVVDLAELKACGFDRQAVLVRKRRGSLHCLYPRVYAVGHAEPPWEGRLLAAVKACGPGAWLSHYSANELFGFVDRLDRIPDVTVTTGSHRERHRIRVHRAASLDPVDMREHLGIPVTSPARALLDLASLVDAHRTRAAIRRALGTGKVTIRQVGQVLERYPGRRGAKTLREAVRVGATPTRSDAESDVLDILLTAGFERPNVNIPMFVAGRRVIPDLRWPTQRLILEVDSKAWHADALARADDRERQALLESHGEMVLRIDWLDAVLAPAKLVSLLIAKGAPPASR